MLCHKICKNIASNKKTRIYAHHQEIVNHDDGTNVNRKLDDLPNDPQPQETPLRATNVARFRCEAHFRIGHQCDQKDGPR